MGRAIDKEKKMNGIWPWGLFVVLVAIAVVAIMEWNRRDTARWEAERKAEKDKVDRHYREQRERAAQNLRNRVAGKPYGFSSAPSARPVAPTSTTPRPVRTEHDETVRNERLAREGAEQSMLADITMRQHAASLGDSMPAHHPASCAAASSSHSHSSSTSHDHGSSSSCSSSDSPYSSSDSGSSGGGADF